MPSVEKPYVLFVAEIIYFEISKIKRDNADFSNIDAIDNFIGTKIYEKISSGNFHDEWFEKLKKILWKAKIFIFQSKIKQKKQKISLTISQ